MIFPIEHRAREQAEETLQEGLELLDAGDEEAAGRSFFKSIEIDPTYADGYNHLGNIALRRADWKQAESLYQKALRLAEPEVKDIPKGGFWGILESRPYMRALHGLGLTAWKDGRINEAISIFEQMLKLNPNDNQGVRYLIGPLFHQKGETAEAFKWYRKNIDDPHNIYNYGLALFQQKKTEQAIEILILAISSNPYVAPLLLGRRLPSRNWWHGTSWAEPDCARDYVEDYGSWWERDGASLALLDLVWSSAEVQKNLRGFFRLRRAMTKVKTGEERVSLGRMSDELWIPENVKRLTAVLYQRCKTPDGGSQSQRPRPVSPVEKFLKSCPPTVTGFIERYGEPRLYMGNSAAREYGTWRLNGTPALEADHLMIYGNVLKDQVLYIYSVKGNITHLSVVDPTDWGK